MKKFSMESLREGERILGKGEKNCACSFLWKRKSSMVLGILNARKDNKIKLDAIQTSGFGPSMLTV